MSSSGHLLLAQHLFGIREPELAFDLLLHLGTLAAVLFFLRSEIASIVSSLFRRDSWAAPSEWGRRDIWLVIVASIPTGHHRDRLPQDRRDGAHVRRRRRALPRPDHAAPPDEPAVPPQGGPRPDRMVGGGGDRRHPGAGGLPGAVPVRLHDHPGPPAGDRPAPRGEVLLPHLPSGDPRRGALHPEEGGLPPAGRRPFRRGVSRRPRRRVPRAPARRAPRREGTLPALRPVHRLPRGPLLLPPVPRLIRRGPPPRNSPAGRRSS